MQIRWLGCCAGHWCGAGLDRQGLGPPLPQIHPARRGWRGGSTLLSCICRACPLISVTDPAFAYHPQIASSSSLVIKSEKRRTETFLTVEDVAVQVKALNLEEGGAFTVSSADNILAGL